MMHLSTAGRMVAGYQVRPELALMLAPRPYLHPVRTPAGVRVTDAVPQDHPWHLGLSVAIQHVTDADGRTANFWGGRTYLPDQGYEWLDDHGRIEHQRWISRDPEGFQEELSWRVPGRSALLRERREVRAAVLSPQDSAWTLRFGFSLENVTEGPISLGSPGSNGRAGAGYGGFFCRAAASAGPLRVLTAQAEGEDAVHGRPSEWLILGGDEPGTGRPWSLLFAGEDEPTRADPWFVRTRDYPGVGSALAYEKAVTLDPGQTVGRSLLVIVADGIMDAATAEAALSTARGQ
jgi:hypothetical protein